VTYLNFSLQNFHLPGAHHDRVTTSMAVEYGEEFIPPPEGRWIIQTESLNDQFSGRIIKTSRSQERTEKNRELSVREKLPPDSTVRL
jgi:hypothetical protein